ncbi:MAG: hypothetical protein HRU41_21370 [Saprospiraceae bacterium]|nr:hypothetical protein [Saprospiraceae bacterium]
MKQLSSAKYLLFAIVITSLFSCGASKKNNSTSVQSSETTEAESAYHQGQLTILVKQGNKVVLPDYDHATPMLGKYPHLGDFLKPFGIKRIHRLSPDPNSGELTGFYRIQFDESKSMEDFIKALEGLDIVEKVEKVAINEPKK